MNRVRKQVVEVWSSRRLDMINLMNHLAEQNRTEQKSYPIDSPHQIRKNLAHIYYVLRQQLI